MRTRNAASLLLLVPASALAAGPALTIDAAADRHPISPYIYGMAYADPTLAKEIRLSLNRWGGDATTRYNWKVDGSNSGDDWFFMAGGKDHPTPSGEPDAWVNAAKAYGGQVMLTIPIIDYVNKATAIDCTFPVSIFGPQQKVNPYVHPVVNGKATDAGNGRKPDGTVIQPTKDQLLRVHIPNTPSLQKGWVKHLVERFGNGGVPIYEMDNEPDGWNNTHRDIHPGATGHSELVNKTQIYAKAVKAADPQAAVLGPGGFLLHYQNDGAPGDGKAEHGGLGQASFYLKEMAAYEKSHGKRLLDYFDEHYYPLGQDGQTDATVLESTRSLWDPTYVEKDWYGQYNGAINLIPSFKKWVAESYPGTKISISEYGWGDMKTPLGALAETDVLGIFGREGLDLACLFGPPKADEEGANAFRLYRNYNGKGGAFGETSVRSVSGDQGTVAVYGAERKSDGALTVMVVNKSTAPQSCRLKLLHFSPASKASVFRYDGNNRVAALPDQTVGANGFTATFPARSATLVVVKKRV
ncbi:hypothetical protein BH11ARM2_BH11ARM2_14160 [soil metagenome]